MDKHFLLSIYILFFNFMQKVINYFYRLFGCIIIVHEHIGNKFVNVTWKYYLNINSSGSFFVKIYNGRNVCYVNFIGNIREINSKMYVESNIIQSRKNISILNKGKIVAFDMTILDNYKSNMSDVSERNVKTIFEWLNIECTDIQFIQLIPYRVSNREIEGIKINELYR